MFAPAHDSIDFLILQAGVIKSMTWITARSTPAYTLGAAFIDQSDS
jgi:hypothetical protein